MGINVNKTISITFAIGSGLAAIAGVLLCSAYPSLTPYTGAMPGIKAFVAAVFGGIGSIPGAFIGGVVLGILEIFGKAYSLFTDADAIVFGVLIVVLVVNLPVFLVRTFRRKCEVADMEKKKLNKTTKRQISLHTEWFLQHI